jgi:LysM repeat protein
MKRDVLRFSRWAGLVLLLALVLISGCTRAKSSGPPEPTAEAGAQTVSTVPPGGEATATSLSGDAAMNATSTALAATATAEAETPQDTEVPATATPTPTEPAASPTPESTEIPEPTEVPTATEPPSSTEGKTHKVQPGENLFRIALKYGLTHQQLAAYNGIVNPNFILAGQVLKIPSGGETAAPPSGGIRYHTVQPGENLFRIALKYNMLFTVLAAANDLGYPYTIYPAQQLIIP